MGIWVKGRDLSGIWEWFGYGVDGVGFETPWQHCHCSINPRIMISLCFLLFAS